MRLPNPSRIQKVSGRCFVRAKQQTDQVRKSMARIKHVLWEGHLKAEAQKAAEKKEAYLAQKAQGTQ